MPHAHKTSAPLCARGGDLALGGAAGRGGSAFPAAALSTGAKARSDTGILPERPLDECGQPKRDGNDRLRATAMPADAAAAARGPQPGRQRQPALGKRPTPSVSVLGRPGWERKTSELRAARRRARRRKRDGWAWLKDTVASGCQDGRNGEEHTAEASTPILSREA